MAMSATASSLARVSRFYEAPVGKKVVMAVTGMVLVGFVLGHMAGNLQIYLPAGADGVYAIDRYGALLHASEELLWGARLVLLASIGLHIWSAIQLATAANAARPVRYVRHSSLHSSYASRTMYWSGPIIGLFIVYHLLHFTTGTVHPDYKYLSVHDNVVKGFSVWYASVAVRSESVRVTDRRREHLDSPGGSDGIGQIEYGTQFTDSLRAD
jgi:succinate dehydrogenase / fumarate reductase cytochrome b subunit